MEGKNVKKIQGRVEASVKYRVMGYDGTIDDFGTEAKARPLFKKKKDELKKAKVKDGLTMSCNIHRCYHDEDPHRPCEIIEETEKS